MILTHATSHSRSGLDPCLLFATFETMLSQLRSTGEINISSFAKHLSSKHDLALSSVDQYIYLHDTVAAAIGKFLVLISNWLGKYFAIRMYFPFSFRMWTFTWSHPNT